ncbi:MAG: class I SAM-dependent methyltransferase [Burkholderiales bacterium]|nr:class I SAM-dependent methyltransferase [Burkholderiales bacterium]
MKNQCRICGSFEGVFLVEKIHGHLKSAWVLCKHCGSAHIDPYPTQEELTKYYNSDYIKMDLSDGMDAGVSHKLRFSDEYRSTVFNEYAYSLNDVGFESGRLINSGDILDYGCADGVFFDFLVAEGVPKENLYGVDIGADMILVAREKGYRCFHIEEISKKNFGLITLWDVIEHVPHPRELVREIKSLLSIGGRVIVQTPHFGDLTLFMKEAFAHYLVVEHLHLFSRKALLALFENEGFECVAQSSFGANAYAKYVSDPYKTAFDKLAKNLTLALPKFFILS